jgi:hypothetical protein
MVINISILIAIIDFFSVIYSIAIIIIIFSIIYAIIIVIFGV